MEISLAEKADVPDYVAFAQRAQASLHSKGLVQWVPAAHVPYGPTIARQITERTLYVARRRRTPVAFFVLSAVPPQWWEDHTMQALYLSGIVVDEASKGLNIGRKIVTWAIRQARVQEALVVRLDCHAGNSWLRTYYEGFGFVERGRVEQHPGYEGCLYEYVIGALTDHRSNKSCQG